MVIMVHYCNSELIDRRVAVPAVGAVNGSTADRRVHCCDAAERREAFKLLQRQDAAGKLFMARLKRCFEVSISCPRVDPWRFATTVGSA